MINILSSAVVAFLWIAAPVFGVEIPAIPPDMAVAQAEQSDNKDLLLYFEEQELTTATKRPTSVRKAPAIATVITAEEIRNMGARDLLDVLKMVPGIGISISEYGPYMVEMRGIRSTVNEKILVLIDGHSINRASYFGSSLDNFASNLPIEGIRRVEVIRGPGAALYGNSAFVAVINIVTRTPEEVDGLEVNSGGGSFGTYRANMVGGKVIGDKLRVAGNVEYYRTDGAQLTVPVDALSVNPNPLIARYSQAPGAVNLKAEKSGAYVMLEYNGLSFRGQYLTKKRGTYIGRTFILTGRDGEVQYDNYWGELAYEKRLTDTLSANIKVSYDYNNQYPNLLFYPSGFRGSFPQGGIERPLLKFDVIGAELQLDWEPFSGNHLITGFSFDQQRQYEIQQLTNFNLQTIAYLGSVQEVVPWMKSATRQTWGVYMQDEWKLPHQINLTAGVRYDHYSDFGDTVNPRAALVWSFLDNAELKILYGQAFRAPSFAELYLINVQLSGNPDLKAERIETYEGGVGWRFSRYLGVEANYFYSTITDQITIDNSTTGHYYNTGTSITQGIELGANGIASKEFSWKLNYAYQDPRNAITGRHLPYVPSQRGSASVTYTPVKYFTTTAGLIWIGPRPRDTGDTRADSPSYATIDLSATLKNFYKTLEIRGAVYNLLDTRYSDPDTSGALKRVPGDFPREGISCMTTVSYRF